MRTFLGTLILIVVTCIAGALIIQSSQADAYPGEARTPATSSGYERILVALGGAIITADIANTDTTRQQGLSGRTNLAPDTGMLFLFSSDGRHDFWMKDMRFPIDIIWFSADKRIITIAQDVSPQTYPNVFTPSTPDRFVLEVPAGFAKKHNLSVGMSAEW